MSSRPTLVGLIGRRGSGKDTAAAVLLDGGYENIKFAGALKAMIRCLLAYQGVDAATIERMIEGDLKEEPTIYLAGRSPRYAMQTLGTEWGRELMGEDFWVGVTMSRAATTKAVITDVRFPNEVEAVANEGGLPIGIEAEWNKPVEGEHESESLIDALIAALPPQQKITNRSAREGEDVSAVIAEFQERFLSLITKH